MDFKDVLASNLHLVNLDKTAFQERLEAVEASFDETFNDAYNQHKVDAFKAFNVVLSTQHQIQHHGKFFQSSGTWTSKNIISLASRVINDGIGDDVSFGEFSVLVDENYNKVQRDIHNQLVMDAFSDAVIEKATSTFA